MATGQTETALLQRLSANPDTTNTVKQAVGSCGCGQHGFEIRTAGAGHSLAELRFEIRAGRDAKERGNYKAALDHFQSAATAAVGFARLAHNDCFNADCAARALFDSRQNVAITLLELGRDSEATDMAEQLFHAMCTGAVLPIGSDCYRTACVSLLPAARDTLLLFLYRTNASEERRICASKVTKRILQTSQSELLAA